jgi:hypothetical protein
LVRALAERGFEDGFVGVVHVAVAVGVAEAAEELIDTVAACFAVSIAVEQVACGVANLRGANRERIVAVLERAVLNAGAPEGEPGHGAPIVREREC